MKFSWKNLEKPIFALAPMEGATDTVFRQIINSCAKPDVSFTEFTNVQGMLSTGKDQVNQRLKYEESERPIIAQVWGIEPNHYYEAAQVIKDMGFDGIDINMGCPERKIIKKGSCSALIKTPNLANQIIESTKKGAGNLPVSIKTRLGFNEINLEWIDFLLNQNIPALTVHLRTVKEMSKVDAHWELAKDLVELKDNINPDTILLGNGDIENANEAKEKVAQTGLDGIMIGRGVFHNPYAFSEKTDFNKLSKKEKLNLLKKHLDLFEKTWGDRKSYPPLKRYFKIYINGFDGASELREKIMQTKSIDEAKEVLNNS